MPVFAIDRNFEVLLVPDAVKLVPELSGLTEKELRYTILVVDYVDSPLRKKPFEERQLIARKMVFGSSTKDPETKKVKIAMDSYKSIVFDIRRETVDIYKGKIIKLQKETLTPDISFSRMKEIDGTITFLQTRVSTIEHELDIEESEEIQLKGQKKLSYIEQWQKKQKNFSEYQKSI
jgi:hypothetical protein